MGDVKGHAFGDQVHGQLQIFTGWWSEWERSRSKRSSLLDVQLEIAEGFAVRAEVDGASGKSSFW